MLTITLLSSTGCSVVENAVAEKWKDEWKPIVMQELKVASLELKDDLLDEAKKEVDARFKKLDVDPAKADWNQDGKYQWDEAVALIREMKAKNDKLPQPFSLIELVALFAAVYGGGSALKGGARMVAKKMEKSPPA